MARPKKPNQVKVTVMLQRDHRDALDSAALAAQIKTGKHVDRSAVIETIIARADIASAALMAASRT